MRIGLTWLAFLLVAFTPAGSALALDSRLDAGGFREEDREVAEDIAAFDAADRHAALVAAGQPEDLLAIAEIQRGSADAFAELLDGLPREDQERVWDLVRYPGLVADLARGGAKSDAELERIAERHPEAIRDAIRREGRARYATWVEIYALDLEAEQAFASVIARHPSEVRAAFQRLRGRPELLSVLTENVGVATRIGAAYREDPTRVEARFDDLHQTVLARKRDQEQEWEKELQDPQAREELRTAAQDFADDNGYVLDDGTTTSTRTVYVHHYVDAYPYPYWFGYPTWYAYPYWYPATVWTHLGFRIGSGGLYVGLGLPSPYFLGWYSGYYYGYPGYWGPGYASWGYYGSPWYSGWAGPRRPFRSAHYYDRHRHTTFHGHRRPRHIESRPHDGYASNRRDAQERLMKDGRRQWSSPRDGRDGSSSRFDRGDRARRPDGFDRREGAGGDRRAPATDRSPERSRERTWRTRDDAGSSSAGPRRGGQDDPRGRLMRRGGEREDGDRMTPAPSTGDGRRGRLAPSAGEGARNRFSTGREGVRDAPPLRSSAPSPRVDRPAARRSEAGTERGSERGWQRGSERGRERGSDRGADRAPRLRNAGGPPAVSSGPPRTTVRRQTSTRPEASDSGRGPARIERSARVVGSERSAATSRLQRGPVDSGGPSARGFASRDGGRSSRIGAPSDGGRSARMGPSSSAGRPGRVMAGSSGGDRGGRGVAPAPGRGGRGSAFVGGGSAGGGGRGGIGQGGGGHRGGGGFGGGGRGGGPGGGGGRGGR